MYPSTRRPQRLERTLFSTSLALTLGAGVCVALAGACSSSKEPTAQIGGGGSGQGGSGSDAGNGGSGAPSPGSAGTFPSFGGADSWFEPPEPTPDGGRSCAASQQQAVLIPANLLFLIDRSGSMNCNPPDGDSALAEQCTVNPVKVNADEPSKWEITREALRGAFDSLADKPNVRVGISVFPKPDDIQNCLVAEAPDVAIAGLDTPQRAAVDALLDAVVPRGDTPIAGTTILGYKYLSEQIRAGTLTGNTFVVLFTDGAETCDPNYLEQLVQRDVALATRFNIKTFVIGAPGSEEGRALLSQVAYEGLTPRSASCDHSGASATLGDCHFDMTTSTDFAAELAAALGTITGDASLSCELDIPTNPNGGGVDRNQVNVTFHAGDGQDVAVLRDDAPCASEAQGWQYSADGTKIVLCGEICDRARSDAQGELEIELGCPTRTVPLR